MEKRIFSQYEIKIITQKYLQGFTGYQLGNEFGCANTTIYRLLKKHNIPRRTRSRNAKERWKKAKEIGTKWNRRKILPEQRFLNNVKIVKSGCWEWQGKISNWGYGDFTVEYNHIRHYYPAHRYSYLLHKGPIIPNNFTIDHICSNHSCVNPKHLRVLSLRDNILAGKGASAKNARKTHCERGHPLFGNNLYVILTGKRAGKRVCKACSRIHQSNYYHNKLA